MPPPPQENYREADGGIEVIVGGKVTGVIPTGHPREEEIRRLVAAGKLVVLPALPAPPPAAPQPTLDNVISALIKKGLISKKDIDDELPA